MENKPKKRIAFLIPSLTYGGMERVMSLLLNKFSYKNVELHLILYGKSREIKYSIPKSINIHRPSFSYSETNRFIFTLKTILYLRKEIKNIKPDSILSFGEYWNSLVLLSLLNLKYPIYISDRSQPNKDLGKIQNKLRNFLYPKATGYIAQTIKASEIAAKNKWNSNITVIGNPIKQNSIQDFGNRDNIILTVGRLIPTKHIDELIEIFRIVNAKDWKLVIVGGNSKKLNLLEEYTVLVQKLGLNGRIELIGATSNVEEYYKKAKIFAFTSISEGFPNVIGEAMSFGLPVIAYDCIAGPSDLIQEGETGFLIKEKDKESYVEKLKLLIRNSDLRSMQGTKALENIVNFDADHIAEKVFTFITNNNTP
jgi:GalNAc-alpha-(1->4)-GalNAc-alpha-(1->3)-diNAcBac-PP-undecaprenol alpha-1,4-N-acetyl-D-galactosaminyltransferase